MLSREYHRTSCQRVSAQRIGPAVYSSRGQFQCSCVCGGGEGAGDGLLMEGLSPAKEGSGNCRGHL